MNYAKISGLFFLCISCINTAIAHTVPLFISLDVTTVFTRPGETQQVNLFNQLGNTYVPNKDWQNKSTVLFGVGATTYTKNNVIFNTGVRYLSISNIFLQGNVWQLNSPDFNNLSYRYRVKSDLVLVENAISYAKSLIQPSLILGLGYAANTTSQYQTSALYNHSATALQVFTGKCVSQLAYEIGGGLDFLSLKPAVIELAYRFMAAGKGALGYSPLQNTSDNLSTGNLYYHTVSLGIRLYYDHTY
jgi:hypothetical protein